MVPPPKLRRFLETRDLAPVEVVGQYRYSVFVERQVIENAQVEQGRRRCWQVSVVEREPIRRNGVGLVLL